MNWTIHEGELDRDDVRALLAQHFAEMTAGTPPSACHVMPADALRDPTIRFFTLRDNDASLLGCGALKCLDPTMARSSRCAPPIPRLAAGSAGRSWCI